MRLHVYFLLRGIQHKHINCKFVTCIKLDYDEKIFITCMALAMTFLMQQEANACTGITLTAKDSARIVARTIEWGGSELNSQYVVVPRGYVQHSYVPGYTLDGMKWWPDTVTWDFLSSKRNS